MERQQAIEARQEILMRLLTFAAPIELLEHDVRALSWDYPEEDIVLLTPTMAVAAIDQAINGEMPIEDLFRWAELLEAREDVGLVGGQQGNLREFLFQASNPEINDVDMPRLINWRNSLMGELDHR
jgi:hypothetical protein